jgi:hypothetical protein
MSIKDRVVWSRWASFEFYWPLVWFYGPSKPSILVTTLSNRPSLIRGGLAEGEWGSPGWRPGRTIAGSQDFISGAETRFRPSSDFADGCRTWDPRGHMYDVLVRFFPYMVYVDSNYRDTLRYEWLFAHCCHPVLCLGVLLMVRGWLWLWIWLSWLLLY